MLKRCVTEKGYIRYSLSVNGKTKHVKEHRAVAEIYIPNPENKKFVNHKNKVRDDNRDLNLEWTDHKENMLHANHGRRRGVIKTKSSFIAQISIDGYTRYLGSFATRNKAEKRYREEYEKEHGVSPW